MYTEAHTEPGTDWLGKLAAEWEKAGDLPEDITTRRVIIRSGMYMGDLFEVLRLFQHFWSYLGDWSI